jgi:hypothetical protein
MFNLIPVLMKDLLYLTNLKVGSGGVPGPDVEKYITVPEL